jgi:hypothetical protein
MNKSKALMHIIKALMAFAIPSMEPDDFIMLEELLDKLLKHYIASEKGPII